MTTNQKELKELTRIYTKLKPDIIKRLNEFSDIWKTESDMKLFGELVFCLLTPQSKARTCWAAVNRMKAKKLLFDGSPEDITNSLKGVRFKNNKTKYILKARENFTDIIDKIKNRGDIMKLRSRLAEDVLGLGYKEASHFLRNIGLGGDFTILDRHILKNLKLLGVIHEIPKYLSKKKYLNIETKMKKFSKQSGIPLSHLDLAMWAREAGEIFK
jgi:N-glycosylase/DNA lyase